MVHTQFQNKKKLGSGPKIIKKYGNRKLYDTEQSSYVVLKDLEKMIRAREEIQVIDNDTQDDITVSTLTQIIFSSEKRSKVSPPIDILKSIIREGDGSFSSFMVKMGLFPSGEEKEESETEGGFSMRGEQAAKLKATVNEEQSTEEKIANLINSGDDLNISDESKDFIPELPGNSLR